MKIQPLKICFRKEDDNEVIAIFLENNNNNKLMGFSFVDGHFFTDADYVKYETTKASKSEYKDMYAYLKIMYDEPLTILKRFAV